MSRCRATFSFNEEGLVFLLGPKDGRGGTAPIKGVRQSRQITLHGAGNGGLEILGRLLFPAFGE